MAVVCLEKLNLAEGTIKDYRQSAFRPLERRLADQGYVDSELLRSQEAFFFQQFEDGTISRHTLNWRIRGIRILVDILDTVGFTWKVFSKKQKESLPEPFRSILDSFMQAQNCGKKHKDCINSICRRFLLSISGSGLRMLSVSHPSMSGVSCPKFQNQDQRAWMMSFTHCGLSSGIYVKTVCTARISGCCLLPRAAGTTVSVDVYRQRKYRTCLKALTRKQPTGNVILLPCPWRL